jgi:hypothetical protein
MDARHTFDYQYGKIFVTSDTLSKLALETNSAPHQMITSTSSLEGKVDAV